MSTEIESLELKISSDSKSAADGIEALTQSLRELKEATKSLGLTGVSKDIAKMSDATKKAKDSNDKASKSFTDFYNAVKAGATIIRSVGKALYSVVEKSMDYTENMNLFSVSMGEYAQGAYDYANIVRDALGIDPSEWVRSQGIFMTMATGFGVASDRASVMSQNLTQLGYDLASFYNMDVEDAMTKLKSGLAGELEPLRAIGYDLSQAKLEATALALGIDKSVSSMTQAEKAQLRYYAIMTQVTDAHGDMARTLDDPANQVRVLKSEFNMAAREIGNMFIPALNAIMPYAIAVTRVVSSLASSIAGLFGYEDEGIRESTSQVVENTDATQENMGAAADEAKKLKSYMLGIDELNVINPGENTSAEDTSDMFDFELPTLDPITTAAESKVATIVEEMKEWLGITGDISSWADLFNTKLGAIAIGVGLVGVAFAAWKITKGVSNLMTWFSNPANVAILEKVAGIGIAIVGAVLLIRGALDALMNGLDWSNFGTMLLGIALLVGGLALAFGTVGAAIGLVVGGIVLLVTGIADFLKNGATAENITTIAVAIGLVALGFFLAFGWVGLIIAAVIAAITAFVMFTEEIVGAVWWVGALFKNVGLWLANLGLAIWTIIKNIGLWFANLGLSIWTIIKNVGLWFANLGMAIWTIIKNIGLWFGNLGKSVWAIIKNTGLWFANLGLGIWEVMKAAVHNVGAVFKNLWVAVQIGFWTMINAFMQGIKSLVQKFEPVLNFLGIHIDTSSMDFAQNKIDSLKESYEEFTNIGDAWEKGFNTYQYDSVKEAYGTFDYDSVKDAIGTFDYDKVKDAYGTFDYDSVSDAFNTFDDFAEGWGTDAYEAGAEIGGGIQDTIKGWLGTDEANSEANEAITDGSDSIIKQMGISTDAITSTFGSSTFSVPKFAGGGFPAQGQMFIAREAGAEMVGSIGRRTAVANNDQIVAGIAGGVAEANEEQNALLREQNALLSALLEKESGVYLDGKNLTRSVEKYQRERGRVLITGGVV